MSPNSKLGTCEGRNVGEPDGPYLAIAISLPLFIILQLLLLIISICQQLKLKANNDRDKAEISLKSRLLYITLQCIALIWTLVDLLRAVIDPHTRILNQEDFSCQIYAFIPKIIPILFYVLYLYQIMSRLETSLSNSYLAIGKNVVYIFYGLIFIPIISGWIVFIILNSKETICFHEWNGSGLDIKDEQFGFCDFPLNDAAIYAYGFVIGWICFLNVIFGGVFSFKLNKLLMDHKDNENIKFQFKSLIVKNTILSLTGSISTVVCWLLWRFIFGVMTWLFLYFELFINCIVIGLMFKYNDNWYKRFCKCCIMICFIKCDRSKDKLSEEEVMRYISYNSTVDLDSLFSINQPGSKNKSKQQIEIEGVGRISSLGDIVSDIDTNNEHIEESNADSRYHGS